ncbi:MAG: response regulator, partial [Pseudomonadota bacterium]
GGDVWAQNNETAGSTFYFTSCLKTIPNKKVRRIRPVKLKGKRVLLSSTSSQTHKILAHELKLAGMMVVCVDFHDLHDFLSSKLNLDFDIAVIDFDKIIKSREKDLFKRYQFIQPKDYSFDFIACSIPVPGISDTFCKAGFKGFLPKPVSRKKLFKMVSYVMGMDDGLKSSDIADNGIVTAHLLSENQKSGVSILLVEDNPVNQKMTQLMLTKAGYIIDIAVNGQQAVHKYTQTPDAFDIIFMDINMPVMNGFEATRQIREFESCVHPEKRIPIIALTANVLDEFKKQCTDVGMDAFLTKPIKRDIVFQAIQKWTS